MPARRGVAPGAPRRRGHPEDDVQEAIVAFHRAAAFSQLAILFAVPNGEKRDPVTAARLSGITAAQRKTFVGLERLRPYGLGVLPGAPDLVLMLPGRVLWIEVKTPRVTFPPMSLPFAGKREVLHEAGRLDPQQTLFQEAAAACGHVYAVVRSVEEYADLLEAHGVPLRSRPFGPGISAPRLPRTLPPTPSRPGP